MTKYIFSTLLITCLGQMAFGQANYPIDSASGSLTQVPSATTGQTAPKPDNYNAASSHDLDSRPLSKGGFFIEPMIIATREDTSIKTSQLSLVLGDTSGKSNGYGVGLRLGGHINEVFLLGVDARYAKTTLDDSFYRKADSNAYDVAPMIALQTPYYGLRLMAGYVVAGESDPDRGYQGLDLKFKEASGWRVGAGVFVASVSLNLEYQDLTYNTTEVQSIGSRAVNNSTKVDANSRGYALSLSFPVEL